MRCFRIAFTLLLWLCTILFFPGIPQALKTVKNSAADKILKYIFHTLYALLQSYAVFSYVQKGFLFWMEYSKSYIQVFSAHPDMQSYYNLLQNQKSYSPLGLFASDNYINMPLFHLYYLSSHIQEFSPYLSPILAFQTKTTKSFCKTYNALVNTRFSRTLWLLHTPLQTFSCFDVATAYLQASFVYGSFRIAFACLYLSLKLRSLSENIFLPLMR